MKVNNKWDEIVRFNACQIRTFDVFKSMPTIARAVEKGISLVFEKMGTIKWRRCLRPIEIDEVYFYLADELEYVDEILNNLGKEVKVGVWSVICDIFVELIAGAIVRESYEEAHNLKLFEDFWLTESGLKKKGVK